MIELALLVILFSAAGTVAMLVWRKVPTLLQVPPQLIEESFVTRPSWIKRYGGPVVHFVRRRGWREAGYAVAVKILTRIRLWLLRMERFVFRALESLETRSRSWSDVPTGYWDTLKQWKQETKENGASIPHAVFNPEPPPSSSTKDTPEDQSPA